MAARRRIDRARYVAGQDHALAFPGAVFRDRHGGEQRLGVGVQRRFEQAGLAGRLNDTAEIHHRHPVADVLDDSQVVGNEQIGQLELVLQVHQQINDLRLYRHVERRDRFVANDQLRTQGQSTSDPDALPLPAGELVWIGIGQLGPQANALEQMQNPLAAFFRVGRTVDDQRLADDLAGRHAWIE